MTERRTWSEIKARRADSPAHRAGYERARLAHELGEKVRTLHEARGLSQAQLAVRMGTTQSVIARLELGGAEPRLDTLRRLCLALDADLTVELSPHEAQAAHA